MPLLSLAVFALFGGYLMSVGYAQVTGSQLVHPVFDTLAVLAVTYLAIGLTISWQDNTWQVNKGGTERKQVGLLAALIFSPIAFNWLAQATDPPVSTFAVWLKFSVFWATLVVVTIQGVYVWTKKKRRVRRMGRAQTPA